MVRLFVIDIQLKCYIEVFDQLNSDNGILAINNQLLCARMMVDPFTIYCGTTFLVSQEAVECHKYTDQTVYSVREVECSD